MTLTCLCFLNYISHKSSKQKISVELTDTKTLRKVCLTNRLSIMNAVSHFIATNQLVTGFLLYRREHMFTGDMTCLVVIAVVQSLRHVHLFVTSWIAAPRPPCPSFISWNLLRFMSTESVTPSNTQLFLSWRVRTCFLSSVCSTLPLLCSNKIVAALVLKFSKKKKSGEQKQDTKSLWV